MRENVFGITDPIAGIDAWFAAARAQLSGAEHFWGPMTLATATPDGHPSARIVLYKGLTEDQQILMVTNYESRKGQELAQNPHAALVAYWPELFRQVRIEGTIRHTSPAQSDQYWFTRPRESCLGAWASHQSAKIASREQLEQELEAARERFKDQERVPRPANWGGLALAPHRVEFWQGRPSRLHDRLEFVRDGVRGAWGSAVLAP